MNIWHTDNPYHIMFLAERLKRASIEGRRIRLSQEGDTLSVKVGEEVWSAPLYATEDPYA